MSWAKIDDRANEHHKLLDAGPEAAWMWTCGLMYANRQPKRDGRIPEAAILMLYPFKAPKKLASKLVAVGLWERADGAYVIHNYHKWNPSPEQVEQARAAGRARAAKSYAARKAKGGDSSPDSSREESTEERSEALDPVGVGVAWSGVGSDPSSDEPDREPRVREADLERPPKPRSLNQALELPVGSRAEFVEQNRHLAEWVQPEAWPEVKAVVAALHRASGGSGAPKAGKYGSDSGIKRVVELYAAGFSEAELVGVCERIVKDPWWVADGGKQRSLGALTVEVVRRATAAPGAVDHAVRKAAEPTGAPYHELAKPTRDDGPVASPTEVRELLGKVIGARP